MRENRTDNQDTVEIDLWKLMMVYLERWKLLLVSGILAGALALGYTAMMITPMYRASVMVYVNNINANETIEYISASNLATAQQLVNTYVTIISSDTVLSKVAENVGDGYTVEDIRRMMTASQVDETELFEVYISHPDPEMAAKIANTIANVAPDEIAYFVEGSSTKIIDYARVPQSPYTPSYFRNAVLGGLLGGLAAVAYVTLGYLMDVRVKDEEDLEQMFDIPLLGQIPVFDEGGKSKDARYGYAQEIQGGEQK